MARWVKSKQQMNIFKTATQPEVVDGLAVGDIWIDITSGAVEKVCTSVSPVTFSTISGTDGNSNVSANNFINGYTTTATAAGTTTLTATSTQQQYFTGTTTQTCVLPVASTLTLGHSFRINNNSTGSVTIQSSGANTVVVATRMTEVLITCILTSGTTAASWSYVIQPTTVNLGTNGAGIAVGPNTLNNASNSGTSAIAIGSGAMIAAYSGSACISIGNSSGAASVSTADNVLVGDTSCNQLSTGDQNTVFGSRAGGSNSSGTSMTSAANNTIIGFKAGVNSASATGCLALGMESVAETTTGATDADHGSGIAIGSASTKVGFRGDGTIYPSAGASAGYWRVKINGTAYKIELFADS